METLCNALFKNNISYILIRQDRVGLYDPIRETKQEIGWYVQINKSKKDKKKGSIVYTIDHFCSDGLKTTTTTNIKVLISFYKCEREKEINDVQLNANVDDDEEST